MLSVLHEAGKQLIRDRPEMLLQLLQAPLSGAIPEDAQIQPADADLTQVLPKELRADLVLHVLEEEQIRLGLVVEVQLRQDPDKTYNWPLYAAALHERLKKQVCLVVVCFDKATAAWARKPILTQQWGSAFRPVVIGPEQIPRIQSAARARNSPHLAVWSALCHGLEEGGEDVVRAAFEGLEPLESETQELYLNIVQAVLGDVAKKVLEVLMKSQMPRVLGDWSKKYIAEGKAEGKAEGRAESILIVLNARGVEVNEEARNRIRDSRDNNELDRWLMRSLQAHSVADLFAEN